MSPLLIEVLDKAFLRVEFVAAPLSVQLTVRHNAVSTCTVEVSNADPAVPALLAEGARLRVTYLGRAYTGPVRQVSGVGPRVGGTLTVRMDDDLRLLSRVLGWPVPGAGLTGQVREYDTRRGPAETVLKSLVGVNAARLGIPLTVEADQGRGAAVRVDARMHPLVDLLLPLVDQAGIGVTVAQVGDGFVLGCYTPRVYPRPLTELAGVVREWEYVRDAPTVTRVVVGGGGEGVKREFVLVADAAREQSWGDVVEVFRDADDAASDLNTARDATAQAVETVRDRRLDVVEARANLADGSGTAGQVTTARTALTAAQTAETAARAAEVSEKALYRAELLTRGGETLAEGAPTAGLKVTLSETDEFRYGDNLRVGDRVTLQVGPGLTVTDVLREAVIDWTPGDGLRVTPAVGEIAGPLAGLVKAVGRLGRSVRDTRARR